jgi:scytalone dehydratase
MVHWYKKIDGVWKLAGTKPGKRMDDFNFDKIFTEESASKAKL